MNSSLYLSDIINRTGLNLNRIKLIRHSLNQDLFRCCYEKGFLKEYTQIQSENFSRGYDYWLVFIGGQGTSAKLIAFYKVVTSEPISPEMMPKGYPAAEMFYTEDYCYTLENVDILDDLIDRLIIDWGKGTLSWHQKATNEKPVLAIQENAGITFSGFENVLLTYNELKEIVEDSVRFADWHTALSSIYAIYLIVDRKTGEQYIGSAYGKGGLLQRWSAYVSTKHGGNKMMKEVICRHPDRYQYFQFSILQILPKTITEDEVIQLESLYKKKLMTTTFGMNAN